MNVQLVDSIRSLIDALPEEERSEICRYLMQNKNAQSVDLNQFSGVIQLQQDPLVYQQQIRDEWTA
ncbi:hypothetical protein ACN4EG_19135 [Alkalinema pantanalense CENA528]|uniref:hypothetical protein n=1 Tax=Alkalinema pantanalense TaxID=1620705 RepID=UPI003D6DE932